MPEKLTTAGHDVYRMPMGTNCVVHRHTEWEPIEAHHVWPKGMGGPDTKANKINVCANAHYAIHEFIRQLMIHNGSVPADYARHFSAKIRQYAVSGWTQAGKPTHGSSAEIREDIPEQLEIPLHDD
jgi:hypothetical protein